ncbi:haloacid dehalogenase-like hydrolase-domain-containing protein [Xylariales sp. AK1849]|nr:haloacid dehalogenase-like hydrolase-domain-containing protein [Xylariales sp. AK1849]
MACCTVAAFFIYRLIRVHEAISSLHPGQVTSLSSKEAPQDVKSSTEDGPQSCRLSLEGLTCTDCSTSVRNALLACPGVTGVHVSFALCQAYITFDPLLIDAKSIKSTVEERGYGAELENESPTWKTRFSKVDQQRRQEVRSWKNTTVASAIFTVLILVLPHVPIPYIHRAPAHLVSLLQAACSAAALFMCAYRIHLEAFHSILRLRPNMALLSSLGLLLGFLQAMLARWEENTDQSWSSPYSDDTLAALCTVVLGGRFLKAITTRSSFALTAQLAASVPRTAIVTFTRDEKQNPFQDSATVPVDMLREGDWVIVPPQTVIPGDGLVVQGTSGVHEALRTGELLPQQKKVGDRIFAGTSNQESLLVVRLTHDANDTWLDKTLECVAKAEGSKNKSEDSIDIVLNRFVTGVICLVLARSLVWWFGAHDSWTSCLERAATMLLCACPCALGLAKPTCITLAIAAASRHDVLLAGGEQQLEDAAKIKAVLFDKTGTLTTGVLHVHEAEVGILWKTSPARTAMLWAAISKIEQHSKHPVAILLAEESKRQLAQTEKSNDEGDCIVEVQNVRIHQSLGVSATVRTTSRAFDVTIGSSKFMESIMPNDNPLIEFNITLDSAHSAVYVSVDGQAAMSVTYSDVLRSDALVTVQTLRGRGVQVGMVTGDTETSARRVAGAVGISTKWTFAGCLPSDKVRVLDEIHKRFGPVAMVGDHFNDIPALASASFSVSVSNGSDISAPINADAHLPQAVKVSFDLLRIPYLLTLAKMTRSKIQTNVLWAIVYNAMALVLSSGSLQFLHPKLVTTPSMASLGMCLSSTFVVLNSMRLARQSSKVQYHKQSADPTRSSQSLLEELFPIKSQISVDT